MSQFLETNLINDPVYGFVDLKYKLINTLISHPYFQRLRFIKQLSLAQLVYPGATHTRFQHSIGSMHLMHKSLNVLIQKGHAISDSEFKAAMVAILLHDIGHGPYSHSFEYGFIKKFNHEKVTLRIFKKLNEILGQDLDLALKIFENKYSKKFFHSLISSQLDLDRMDYLNRDSFFTGVADGIIPFERIIATLNLYKNEIVIEEKGIYSIENFIIARRLMYWQVYLHKAVVAAETLLINILQRAKELALDKNPIFCLPYLQPLLFNDIDCDSLVTNDEYLDLFLRIDDADIFICIKNWQDDKDFTLSYLSKMLLNRNLYKILLQNKPFSIDYIEKAQKEVLKHPKITDKTLKYFINTGKLQNNLYNFNRKDKISILTGNKIANFSDYPSVIINSNLAVETEKYYLYSYFT